MATVKVSFNPVFRPANETHCRYRVMKGSAGSGKSMNVAQDYILKLMDPRYRGANLLVVRKAEGSNKDSTFAELYGAITRICGTQAPMIWQVTGNPLAMTCLTTGARIIFRGMNDARQRERVKSISFPSGKLTWIWVEEATEQMREMPDNWQLFPSWQDREVLLDMLAKMATAEFVDWENGTCRFDSAEFKALGRVYGEEAHGLGLFLKQLHLALEADFFHQTVPPAFGVVRSAEFFPGG